MRLAIISDARLPTLPIGGHGLGRSAHDIATGLAARDHEVTLFAGPTSSFASGELRIYESESMITDAYDASEFDVALDTSHQHLLSALRPDYLVANRIADLECKWMPPCAIVNSWYTKLMHPKAIKIATGIDIEAIPFYPTARNGRLVFASAKHAHKGYPFVRSFAEKVGRDLDIVEGALGKDLYDRLGAASALLHPSNIDAAPRLPLEAAACGTPTICYALDGASEHVENGRSGFICNDDDELVTAAQRAETIVRGDVRAWVAATHSIDAMVDAYEDVLVRVFDGWRW